MLQGYRLDFVHSALVVVRSFMCEFGKLLQWLHGFSAGSLLTFLNCKKKHKKPNKHTKNINKKQAVLQLAVKQSWVDAPHLSPKGRWGRLTLTLNGDTCYRKWMQYLTITATFISFSCPNVDITVVAKERLKKQMNNIQSYSSLVKWFCSYIINCYKYLYTLLGVLFQFPSLCHKGCLWTFILTFPFCELNWFFCQNLWVITFVPFYYSLFFWLRTPPAD